MRVLVYKRTHNGDPDAAGCFGAFDCMGTVRDREYDAVVGVGGIGPEAVSNSIDGEVNWVGIGPHKRYVEGKRGPEVLFDHFRYFGTEGPDFLTLAPQLAARMYGDNVRSILDGMTDAEQDEAETIAQLAADWPPSPGLAAAERFPRAVAACSAQPPPQELSVGLSRRSAAFLTRCVSRGARLRRGPSLQPLCLPLALSTLASPGSARAVDGVCPLAE